MAEQGNIESFFNNPKNADELGGLVWDIHDAVIAYQVCDQNKLIMHLYLTWKYVQTSLQQDVYDKSCQLIVSLSLLQSNYI